MSGARFKADGVVKSIVQDAPNLYIVHVKSENNWMPTTWPVSDKVARELRIGAAVHLEISIDA